MSKWGLNGSRCYNPGMSEPRVGISGEAASPDAFLDTACEGRIATVTLNRPARRNALSASLLDLLGDLIERVRDDDRVRVLVLTGSGGAFCAGADFTEMTRGASAGPHALGQGGADALRRGFAGAQRVILGLQRLEKPVIAAVDGVAAGAGFDLACACDIRIASTRARFMTSYVKLGLFPGYGGTWLYPRLLGMARAAEMVFTGDELSAVEAERAGLVNRVVAPEDLAEEVEALAGKIADGPPIAMRLAKMLMYRGMEVDLETAMHMAAAAEPITLSSRDHLEGLAALREKRAPEFRGT